MILETVGVSDSAFVTELNHAQLDDLPRTSTLKTKDRASPSPEQNVYEIRKLAAKGIRNSIVMSNTMSSIKKKNAIGFDRFEYKSKLGSSDYSANTKWAEMGVGAMKYEHSPENRAIQSASSCFRNMSRQEFYKKLKKVILPFNHDFSIHLLLINSNKIPLRI